MCSNTPSSDRSGIYLIEWDIQTWAGPEDTNKLHEELAKMFMMLNPVNYSSSQPAPKAPGGVPCHQVTEEGKTQLGLEVLLHDM